MEWDGGSRVQTYLSILCFDAQFSRKGSAGFRFAASQVVCCYTSYTPIQVQSTNETSPKTLCSGHIENKGVVGTLPGIDAQGSYVAVVFKLNSRWPETTVCCPKTLCSGHLENKGLVATILFPGMARMRLQSCGFEAKFKVA